MLHVRCGDDILDRLSEAGVPGTVMGWLDAFTEGPVPAGLEASAFRSLRAGWLAERYGLDRDGVLFGLSEQDRLLDEAAATADEVVLWIDPGLLDQVVLVALIVRLWPLVAGRLSLVCIDRHADVRRFMGLGQLTPAHLAALFAGRRRVGAAQAALALRAWQSFTADTPLPLEALLAEGDLTALPCLRGALDRHRRQYPWRRHGLALSAWRALEAVAADCGSFEAVFARLQARERVPWRGRAMVWAELQDLAWGPDALVAVTGESVAVTEAGRAVLAGRRRASPLGRSDRWLGGVAVSATSPAWCWDDDQKKICRCVNAE